MEEPKLVKSKKGRKENMTREISLFNPKTINSRYIRKISKSEKFISDLMLYIHRSFLDDYCRTREFKISKVLEKCYEHLESKKEGKRKVVEYIEVNAKCKLPWTDRELKKAQESVIQLLKEY